MAPITREIQRAGCRGLGWQWGLVVDGKGAVGKVVDAGNPWGTSWQEEEGNLKKNEASIYCTIRLHSPLVFVNGFTYLNEFHSK